MTNSPCNTACNAVTNAVRNGPVTLTPTRPDPTRKYLWLRWSSKPKVADARRALGIGASAC